MFQNNPRVNEEIKREIRSHFELNQNEDIMYQSWWELWDNKFLLFKPLNLVVFCYGSPGKLTQAPLTDCPYISVNT